MSTKRHAAMLVILIVLFIVIGLFAYRGRYEAPAPTAATSTSMRIPPPQPPMTAADTVAEQNKHPFSLLISYVDSGFEPATAHIHAGDTVRFTNNATTELWISASGTTLYPSIQNGCGSSALDSCGPLKPGEFWQFTFAKAGTWTFVNNFDKSKQGTVIVAR